MSYGEVAASAGYPKRARMVSPAMSRCKHELPWYRVVRADRSLAFEAGSDAYKRQRELLESEGARFVNGKVVARETAPENDLDSMLWGPDS